MKIISKIITEIDTILLKVFSPVRWKRLTAKLERLLQRTWNAQQEAAIEAAIERLENAGEAFTSEDLEIVMATLEEHLGRPMTELIGDEVASIQQSAYEEAFKDLDLELTFGKKDARVLRWLEQDALYWIETYYEREVRDQLQETMRDVLGSGESRLNAGKRLQQELGERVKKDNLYWEGLSNHITTRTREFAKVSGYLQAGVTFIEIRAVLDNRTSEICRYMHGRVFKVTDARNIREKLIRTDTPDEIKRVAPWISGGSAKRMKTAKLADEGVILPPYHWNCRTTTVMWSEETIEGNEVEEMEFGENLTAEKKNELSVYTEAEYSNWLRDFRSARKNIEYHPGDLEQDMKEHAPAFGITKEDVYILSAKKTVATARDVLAQVWRDGNIQFLFFGEDGVVVCDSQFFIRGYYPHTKAGGINKALDAFKRKCLWLRLKPKKKS